MKRMWMLVGMTTWVLAGAGVGFGQHTRAIVENIKDHPFVRVGTGKYHATGTPAGSLYYINDDNEQIQLTSEVSSCSKQEQKEKKCQADEFIFYFPQAAHYDPQKSYAVNLMTPVKLNEQTETIILNIPVTTGLTAELERNFTKCRQGIGLLLRSKDGSLDWTEVQNWLSDFQQNQNDLANIEIRIRGGKAEKWIPLRLASFTSMVTNNSDLASICLLTTETLPAADFAARVTLHGARLPAELESVIAADELAGRPIGAANDNLERNVDLNGTLSSSVKNKDVPAAGTTPATTVRQRTTRGALDLKFVPISSVWHPIIDDNKWMHFLTPLVIDAKVSTGKIVEDTLSANRILIGIEGEARYRRVRVENDRRIKVATNRIIYGFTHASDRDFKQDEFTAKLEYKPVVWKLNRPINLNYTINQFKERVPGTFGYSFVPVVGFEIGKTYHRENPAAAIKPSDTVRRLYFGLDASLDITPNFTFKVSDIFYIRGETPDHRQRNYFKGEFEAPLGEAFKNTVHSFVFSFERGDLAPFASPSVNAVKFGYRLQTSYCSPNCR